MEVGGLQVCKNCFYLFNSQSAVTQPHHLALANCTGHTRHAFLEWQIEERKKLVIKYVNNRNTFPNGTESMSKEERPC